MINYDLFKNKKAFYPSHQEDGTIIEKENKKKHMKVASKSLTIREIK